MTDGKIRRICIYGTGGVGGYFGGLLCGSSAEQPRRKTEIDFIARGAHLDEIKKSGLLLNTADTRNLVCKPAHATETFSKLQPPDLIILTVKGYDLEATIQTIAENINDDTVILPLLNGVDIYERIRSRLSRGIVFPACVYVVSNIEKPGVVTQKGAAGKIMFGKDPKHPAYVPEHLLALFRESGIQANWMENPFPAIWEKYLFIAPFALVTGRYGATFGSLMASTELKEKTRELMREVIALAKCQGIEFRNTVIEETLGKANNFPYDSKTSFQRDLEQKQKGKQNEGDLFGGTIIRLGEKYGVPTPATAELYAALLKM